MWRFPYAAFSLKNIFYSHLLRGEVYSYWTKVYRGQAVSFSVAFGAVA